MGPKIIKVNLLPTLSFFSVFSEEVLSLSRLFFYGRNCKIVKNVYEYIISKLG
jgi:hypothetical protein